ncbi:MAG: hypothetical protein HYR88_06930 [Verrucomicrobia bacterium]|nr:hypothetical protein [Verrucomicrobiota bacterium]MBI3870630.1 hypothetical protein [Verrucomicrobiota bacterium]
MIASIQVPVPKRIPPHGLFAFAALLLLGQLATGTSLLFAELVFLFVVLSGLAVNIAGGMRSLQGFCVSMMALKLVVISQVTKALFGEAAEDQLETPVRTMLALLLGLISVTAGMGLARVFHSRRPLFQPDISPEALRMSFWATFVIGFGSFLGVMATGVEEGALMVGGVPGLLRQLSFCLGLSIVFSTAYVLVTSKGRRLIGWFNALPGGLYFIMGVMSASKQGMSEPLLLVVFTAIGFGFRFSAKHWLAGGAFAAFCVAVLFPFGQVARNYTRGYGFWETLEVTAAFAQRHLGTLDGYRDMMQQDQEGLDSTTLTHYYRHSIPLLERVSLVKVADMLVAATMREGGSGWETITHGFKMAAPRFFYPQKPAVNTGTFLGKKAGVISDDDWGTQVSFGFIADAYSAFEWWGVLLIPGLIAGSFSLLFSHLVGEVRGNPWCIYLYAEYQHFFAEQTIAAMTLTVIRRPLWLVGAYASVRILLHLRKLRVASAARPRDEQSTLGSPL